MWGFRAMDVSGAFLTPQPLKRDTYAKPPDGVEMGNVAWGLSTPLYGLSTAWKYWYASIMGFWISECALVGVVWGGRWWGLLPFKNRYRFGGNGVSNTDSGGGTPAPKGTWANAF